MIELPKRVKDEAGLAKEIISHRPPRSHINRVESHEVTPGFPDLEFCIQGVNGHMELKCASMRYGPKIRSSQYQWFRARMVAGQTPWLCCFFFGYRTIVLYPGTSIDDLYRNKRYGYWYNHDSGIHVESWRHFFDTITGRN